VAIILRVRYHSCYSSRGRRLYSRNEHDSSRIMSSSRVGFLSIAWDTFPQHCIEIPNPYGRSAILFKRRSSSIVRLSCHSINKKKNLHGFLSITALNSKERVYYDDASLDSRFSSEAGQTPHRSVICLPIFSNRGQTFGVVYFASKYPFSQNTVTILTLLCQQASISIANALLFRSVQTGTRENLKMIATQKEALEAARKSREDALKATKVGFVCVVLTLVSDPLTRSKATS